MMTGTVALSRMLWISAGPPRGIRQSTTSVSCMTSTAASWRDVVDEEHRVLGEAGLGEPVAQRVGDGEVGAQRAPPTPAGCAALPDFRQRPAASLVTLGRFS